MRGVPAIWARLVYLDAPISGLIETRAWAFRQRAAVAVYSDV